MILKWGKPSKFQKAAANPASSATWSDLPMPKEGTLSLQSQDGQETTANEEGGELVDVRYGKATYTLEWDEFDIEGKIAFDDVDGIVSGEYAIRILPEDDNLKGFIIRRCVIRVTKSYNTTDGSMRHYTVRALKPASGKTLDVYKKN